MKSLLSSVSSLELMLRTFQAAGFFSGCVLINFVALTLIFYIFLHLKESHQNTACIQKQKERM